MSKSWRNSWGSDLKVRESRGYDNNDWKRELFKELEVNEPEKAERPIFVIMDEWETMDAKYSSTEIVGSKYFFSMDDAWEALSLMAESHSVDLGPDEYSFEPIDLPADIEYESYYIMELING